MFVTIFLTILTLQFLITQFTGDIFQVSRSGLTPTQWLICLALGLLSFPIHLLVISLPDSIIPFCTDSGSSE